MKFFADNNAMGLSTALKWGGAGLFADVCAPYLTRGLAAIGGFVAGLFQPEARDFDRAYNPDRFGLKSWGTAAVAVAAAAALPIFGELFWFGNAGSLFPSVLSPSAWIPFAYSHGALPNWGMMAGWLT